MHAPEIWERLLDRLAGGEALAAICRDDDMPGTSTVYERIDNDAEFSGRFRARKAIGVRAIADDCLQIADEKVAAGDATAVANKRVRIDTRLRLAGKWLAAEFGDKTILAGDADNPIATRHTTVLDVTQLSTEALKEIARLAAPDPS